MFTVVYQQILNTQLEVRKKTDLQHSLTFTKASSIYQCDITKRQSWEYLCTTSSCKVVQADSTTGRPGLQIYSCRIRGGEACTSYYMQPIHNITHIKSGPHATQSQNRYSKKTEMIPEALKNISLRGFSMFYAITSPRNLPNQSS